MKKTYSLLFSCFLAFVTAQSLKLGVTANFHKTSIVNIHDYSKTPWGGGGGAYAEFTLVENDIYDSSWLYLVPQLEFSMQGENAEPDQGKQKFPFYYVGMPIYLKYFLHQENIKRNVFFFGGPRLEYLVYNDRKGPEVYDMFKEQEKRVSKLGYGVSLGAGVSVSDNLEVFIRFDRGFSKVYPDYLSGTTYNRLLGIGFNYVIFASRY
ncbi:outer membrane beta-barrel protein [Chryseobacterium sp. T1]